MPKGTTQKVYETMMRRIITSEIAPGEVLIEVELAKQFNTSRTPIREACIHLLKEGFLRAIPRRGYSVTELSLDEIRELYQLRLMLEPPAAELAAEAALGKDFFSNCSALIERYKKIAEEERTYEKFLELGTAEYGFHHEIAKASGNKKLAKTMAELMNQFRRFHYTGFRKSMLFAATVEEHMEILDAIRLHDGGQARQMMYKHVQMGAQRAFQLVLGSLSTEGRPWEKLSLENRDSPPTSF
jgi:GntR family transcriptional regulator, rspAB operon transcriptional repressor